MRGKRWKNFALSSCLWILSSCATVAPGAGGFPVAVEPQAFQVDVTLVERSEGSYYLIAKTDMDRLTAYVNALRLAFRENLISLRRCAGQ